MASCALHGLCGPLPGVLQSDVESIHFMDAWRIPGVASFAFCLFFSKLIAYTFLYWLPYYIKSTPIEGRKMTAKEAGDLSVLFDVGGVAGGARRRARGRERGREMEGAYGRVGCGTESSGAGRRLRLAGTARSSKAAHRRPSTSLHRQPLASRSRASRRTGGGAHRPRQALLSPPASRPAPLLPSARSAGGPPERQVGRLGPRGHVLHAAVRAVPVPVPHVGPYVLPAQRGAHDGLGLPGQRPLRAHHHRRVRRPGRARLAAGRPGRGSARRGEGRGRAGLPCQGGGGPPACGWCAPPAASAALTARTPPGTHAQGNSKALATVSAIIDGMGSLGAALGPMLTGFISDRGGFDMVFAMLYASAITAGALLAKLVAKELASMRSIRGPKPI
jgi:hypothetical protein